MKNDEISAQKIVVEEKNSLLSKTIDELAMVKRSRKSWIFSISTAIVLVLLTEIFLDPFIEEHSYNEFLSLAAKVLIALLLKPMETVYERVLYKKALKVSAS
jgi:membrane-associated HD superfamily phosphohydrolase